MVFRKVLSCLALLYILDAAAATERSFKRVNPKHKHRKPKNPEESSGQLKKMMDGLKAAALRAKDKAKAKGDARRLMEDNSPVTWLHEKMAGCDTPGEPDSSVEIDLLLDQCVEGDYGSYEKVSWDGVKLIVEVYDNAACQMDPAEPGYWYYTAYCWCGNNGFYVEGSLCESVPEATSPTAAILSTHWDEDGNDCADTWTMESLPVYVDHQCRVADPILTDDDPSYSKVYAKAIDKGPRIKIEFFQDEECTMPIMRYDWNEEAQQMETSEKEAMYAACTCFRGPDGSREDMSWDFYIDPRSYKCGLPEMQPSGKITWWDYCYYSGGEMNTRYVDATTSFWVDQCVPTDGDVVFDDDVKSLKFTRGKSSAVYTKEYSDGECKEVLDSWGWVENEMYVYYGYYYDEAGEKIEFQTCDKLVLEDAWKIPPPDQCAMTVQVPPHMSEGLVKSACGKDA